MDAILIRSAAVAVIGVVYFLVVKGGCHLHHRWQSRR
jgi:hypothetical protein